MGNDVAGFFRRLSITRYEVELLFERAGKWAKDDKVNDRLDAVRNTYARAEDAPTTGAKKLEELMATGKEFVASINKIWGGDIAGISKGELQQMNEKHAVLFDQAGNFIVLTETTEDGKFQLRFSDPATMSLL